MCERMYERVWKCDCEFVREGDLPERYSNDFGANRQQCLYDAAQEGCVEEI